MSDVARQGNQSFRSDVVQVRGQNGDASHKGVRPRGAKRLKQRRPAVLREIACSIISNLPRGSRCGISRDGRKIFRGDG